ALAQTLISEPRVLLMDERFGALDVQTRTLMENELLQLWSATRASVVFVTHDLEEAIALADRVVVITAGPGTVKGVYRVDLPRPRNVAEIRFQPEFSRIYQEIWNDLRDEVLVSYERSKHSVSYRPRARHGDEMRSRTCERPFEITWTCPSSRSAIWTRS